MLKPGQTYTAGKRQYKTLTSEQASKQFLEMYKHSQTEVKSLEKSFTNLSNTLNDALAINTTVTKSFGAMGIALDVAGKIVSAVSKVWQAFINVLRIAYDVIKKVASIMWDYLKKAVIAFGAAIGFSIREGLKFIDTMAQVQIQAGATADEMLRLKELSLDEEFSKMGKSGTEVASVMQRLASEGYGVAETQAMLKPIMNTIAVLGTDEAQTVKLMLNVMQQFRMGAQDMARISDILVNALSDTSFQADELVESLKHAGVAGNYVGQELTETISILDVLIKVTGEAGIAGRGFRQLMFSLKAPPPRLAKEFKRVGMNVDDLTNALTDPVRLTELLTEAQRRGMNFARGFSVQSAAAAAALAGNTQQIRQNMAALNQQGTAEAAVKVKTDNLAGSWAAFVAIIKNVGIKITEGLAGPLSKLLNTLTDLAQAGLDKGWFENLGESLGNFFNSITLYVQTYGQKVLYNILAWISHLWNAVALWWTSSIGNFRSMAVYEIMNLFIIISRAVMQGIAWTLRMVADGFRNLGQAMKAAMIEALGPVLGNIVNKLLYPAEMGIVLQGKAIGRSLDAHAQLVEDIANPMTQQRREIWATDLTNKAMGNPPAPRSSKGRAAYMAEHGYGFMNAWNSTKPSSGVVRPTPLPPAYVPSTPRAQAIGAWRAGPGQRVQQVNVNLRSDNPEVSRQIMTSARARSALTDQVKYVMSQE